MQGKFHRKKTGSEQVLVVRRVSWYFKQETTYAKAQRCEDM